MPVCLHCGEIGPDGALFCSKCGYTLPQVEAGGRTAPLGAQNPSPGPLPPPSFGQPAAVVPPRVAPAYVPVGPYAAPSVPGAVGPIPTPPNAKYCSRCATVISSVAVYCPVCQQPQG